MGIGKVAKCSRGRIGLVLTITKIRGIPLYKGVCLDSGRVGWVWQSLNPRWIGTLDDWVKLRYGDIQKVLTPTERST